VYYLSIINEGKHYYHKPVEDVEYAYLINNGHVYDFIISDKDHFSIDLLKGQVSPGEMVTIVFQNKEGFYFYDTVNVSNITKVGEMAGKSRGTRYSELSGTITMTPQKKNCSFNAVVLQLRTKDGEFISELSSASRPSVNKGSFVNAYNDGDYILRIKANSNIQDEYVDIKISLKKGQVYGYIYNVFTCDTNKVTVNGIAFYK